MTRRQIAILCLGLLSFSAGACQHRRDPGAASPAAAEEVEGAVSDSNPGQAAEPLQPRLLTDTEQERRDELLAEIEGAEAVAAEVEMDGLDQKQSQQLAIARSFLAQARRALERSDLQRASILVDKGTALIHDLVREERPAAPDQGAGA